MAYNYRQQFNWIWSFSQRYRSQMSVYFILELSGIAFSLFFVYWSKLAVDRATADYQSDLTVIFILIVVAVLSGLATRSVSSWIDEVTRLQMSVQLQNWITKQQMLSSWSFLKKRQTGDLMIRIQEDSKEVVQMIGVSGLSFVITLFKLLASLFFLWSMDPILASMILIITPLFLFSKLYFKKIRILNQEAKSADSAVGNIIQENLRFRMLIRALGILVFRDKKLRTEQDKLLKLKLSQINFSLLSNTIMRFTMNAGYLIAFIWGVYRLHNQEITFGTMTAFLQLVGRIQTPLLSAAAFVPSFVRFRVSLDRILELFDNNPKNVEASPVVVPDLQSLRFENVSFRYEEVSVIQDFNLQAYIGKPIAIVGSSGRGKTTLMRLLLSLCYPDTGSIILETTQGEKHLLEGKHRTNFAYVPQGNSLFTGTIEENLAGQLSLSSKQINYALELACATFVHDLPQGIHTFIGESGYGLSEGQAQRIAIARAVIRNVPVWLFDEPTSALDEKTSSRLVDNLLQEGKNKIIIFVTHDLNLAERCETTVYLH